MRETRVTPRAKRVWQRLMEFYGARLTDQYGAAPPESWCEVIDDADNEQIQAALMTVRAQHLQFPPTLPEFESAIVKAKAPEVRHGPADQRSQLVEWIVANKPLTPRQLAATWSWFGSFHDAPRGEKKQVEHNFGCTFAGVEIPPDGDAPGYRVTFEDMQISNAA